MAFVGEGEAAAESGSPLRFFPPDLFFDFIRRGVKAHVSLAGVLTEDGDLRGYFAEGTLQNGSLAQPQWTSPRQLFSRACSTVAGVSEAA